MTTLRVAILNAEDAVKWQGLVNNLWGKIFKPPIKLDEYLCFRGEFPNVEQAANDYALLVIGGSHYGANDEEEWIKTLSALIPLYVDKGAKIIGCCFGHQLIAKALGGRVGTNPSGKFQLGVEQVVFNKQCLRACRLDEIFEPILKKDGMISANSTSSCRCRFLESHGDQVIDVPLKAKILAISDSTQAEVLWYPNSVLTFQFHPELTNELVTEKIWRARKDRMEPEAARDSYQQLTGIFPDSESFHSVLLNFMLDGRTDSATLTSNRIQTTMAQLTEKIRAAAAVTNKLATVEYETLEDLNHVAAAKYAELAAYSNSMSALAVQTVSQHYSVQEDLEKLSDVEKQVDRLLGAANALNEDTVILMRELGLKEGAGWMGDKQRW